LLFVIRFNRFAFGDLNVALLPVRKHFLHQRPLAIFVIFNVLFQIFQNILH